MDRYNEIHHTIGVLVYQANVRGLLVRTHFKTQRHSMVVYHTKMRQFLVRIHFTSQRHPVVVYQAIVRR